MQQPVVIEYEHCVRGLPEQIETLERSLHTLSAFDCEWGCDDCYDQGSGALGLLCDYRCDAGSGSTAQTGGDEDEVGTADYLGDDVSTGLGAAPSGDGVTAGSEPPRDVPAHQQLLHRSGVVEVLLVGVDGDGDGTLHSDVRDPIHRVVARAAATADQNTWVGGPERLELLVDESGRNPAVWNLVYR